ncbi:MAG TPA: glycosyltransferase family 39 protein [Planctomycetaceae bacterium]|nr:glycosyltransferase family 39 protein [Planctomycetaceae bacterium]
MKVTYESRLTSLAAGARVLVRWLVSPAGAMLAALVLIAAFRLATLGTLALTDNTEARYAEIGWQMCRSGDWVTPRLYMSGELVPFWAKPPLFFWTTAWSFGAFGASEWAARFPNFLFAALMVGSTIVFGRNLWGNRVGALAGLILASSGLFFVLAGSCVLDMALAASVSAALMCFALFIKAGATGEASQRWWGRAFFVALGFGCLAKGPVAVVLVGLSLAAWIVMTKEWRAVRKLPWFTGVLLVSVIAVPWYLLAERATPGFLRYFLVNEHILRYVRSDYGDLYGNGRTQIYGASWVMLAVTFLPWSPWLMRCGIDRLRRRGGGWHWRLARQCDSASTPRDAWLLFALCWGLTPAIFFTLCRQILVTYMLPGFPGLALATAVLLVRWAESERAAVLLRGLRIFSAGLGGLLAVALIAQIVLGPLSPLLAATLLAVGLFAGLLFAGFRRSDSGVLLTAVGFGSPLLVAMFTIAVAPAVNEAFSTKTILASTAALPESANREVFFPLTEEYSAEFYQEAFLGGRIEHQRHKGLTLLVQKLQEPAPELFVFRRNAWEELEPAVRASLEPATETPHWVACRSRGPAPREAARIAVKATASGN